MAQDKIFVYKGQQEVYFWEAEGGVSMQLTGHSEFCGDVFISDISDNPSQPPCTQTALTVEPQAIRLQCQ